jgi:hypothetical protein
MLRHLESETKFTNFGKLIRLRISLIGLLKEYNFFNTLAVVNCQ